MNNYKLLPALVSLLQTRNLTASAEALNVTQSAMSKTLSQIREAFGDQILVREANRFVLTRRAQELQQQLPNLMAQLDELYLSKPLDLARCERRFTFASSDYVAQAVFPRVCEGLHQQAPLAGIEYLVWHKDLLMQLHEHPVDVVSTIAQEIPENLYGKKMAQDTQVCIFRPEHPLSSQAWNLEQYIAAQHILITGGGDKDTPVDSALLQLGLKRRIFARMPFFQGAVELLKTTDTVMTTPLHIAADFAIRYGLQLRPLPIELPPHDYYLLWHAKHHQDSEHRWFRELCFELLRRHLNDSVAQGMKLIHSY